MKYTYRINNGMYIYKGPRGHSGIAYSIEQVNERLTKAFGAGNYELTEGEADEVVDRTQESLSIAVEGDHLVIRIGVDCLCNITEMSDTWPARDEDGTACKILDRKQFLLELVKELERDDEQGATAIHLAFDQAALGVMESGSDTVELPYDG